MSSIKKKRLQTALREKADAIYKAIIRESLPDMAVRRALDAIELGPNGKIIVISIGKAGWQMAKAAAEALEGRISKGLVITKHGYCQGAIAGFELFEAGHPVPDRHSIEAAEAAMDAVKELGEGDTVLLLLSGGGSTLFEKPLVPLETLASVTKSLLACGADIVEMNTIRKRLSAVKGGRFALMCRPAKVYSVILSDIIGDPPDMIASGPAYPDASTCGQALDLVKKYDLDFPSEVMELLGQETPKRLDGVTTLVTGGVTLLTRTAEAICREHGFETTILTDSLDCEAKEAGRFLAAIARFNGLTDVPRAFIAGGETVVHVTGKGKGGRNQELALSAADSLAGMDNAAVFSLASDGSDGPTDASGGYADGNTKAVLDAKGIKIYDALKNNDAYHALQKCGGLIFTGPTGTNVNDVAIVLIMPRKNPPRGNTRDQSKEGLCPVSISTRISTAQLIK